MNAVSIFKHWLKKGFRITPVREVLVKLFLSAPAPLSVKDISRKIASKGFKPNKTTLYREIEFLKKQNFINEMYFQDSKKFYEIVKPHHHHLICRKCDSIHDIKSDEAEDIIYKIQTRLQGETAFKNVGHSLEFFGICPDCNLNL